MVFAAKPEERWFPTEKGSTTVTKQEASNALSEWWNSSLDFQRSKAGFDSLATACALNLMVARGEDGFTEKELEILVQKIQELRMLSAMGKLVKQGHICISLVKKSEESSSYELAFGSSR